MVLMLVFMLIVNVRVHKFPLKPSRSTAIQIIQCNLVQLEISFSVTCSLLAYCLLVGLIE